LGSSSFRNYRINFPSGIHLYEHHNTQKGTDLLNVPTISEKFRKEFPTSQQQKETYQYMCLNIFSVTAPTFAHPQCFRLLFARILKTALLSAPVKDEKKLNQHIYDACQTICNSPVTFWMVRGSLIRSVCVCVGWGGVYYNKLFWIWLDKQ
jgi:hypothetical protein